MSDLYKRALMQALLGGSSAMEDEGLLAEVCRRVILSGISVNSSGVWNLGLPTFGPSTIANLGAAGVIGDIPYYDTTTTLARLAAGAANTLLKGTGAGSVPAYSKLVNADVDAAAAIAYSKLNLALSIVNADIGAGAAIGWSKIDKAGSSLADLATRSAADLSSGNLAQARLGLGTFSVVSSTTTGATNNWAPTLVGNTLIEWNGASGAQFTGLDGGVTGQIVTIKNVTAAQVATFAHASASSDVDNRFTNLATSAATPIAAGGWITYQHDGTNWKLIGHEQGALITTAFSAADYTASAGSWTVDSADVATAAYRLHGNTIQVFWNVQDTDVSATPAELRIAKAVYGGFTTAKTMVGACAVSNAGTREGGVWVVANALAFLRVERVSAANFSTTAADNTAVFGVAVFEVT